MAVFSYRYDAHLVPGLLENIGKAVHGYVAWDDRRASRDLSDEPMRRNCLLAEAIRLGADWILAVDPDERFEDRLATRMAEMTSYGPASLWAFPLYELFTPDLVRTDGIWGVKLHPRLFHSSAVTDDLSVPLHANWMHNPGTLRLRGALLNIYHLRMASPLRRKMRRDLYAAADPARLFQKIGYDYLDDERSMTLRPIQPGRGYSPVHVEDHGIWAPDPAAIGDLAPDPYEARLCLAAMAARRRGHGQAHFVLEDLRLGSPDDRDFRHLSARLALADGRWETAISITRTDPAESETDLLPKMVRVLALAALGRPQDARGDLAALQAVAPDSRVVADLARNLDRGTADFSVPDAQWRRWVTGPATCVTGDLVPDAELAVIVLSFQAQADVLAAVQSVLDQDAPAEIVVVNTGGGDMQGVLAPVLHKVRLICVDEPKFVGAARNIGIEASRAPFVAFLAGDCTARPNWVSGRMAVHRAGELTVATAVVEQAGSGLVGIAANRLRYWSRRPDAPSYQQSWFGRSYARTLLSEIGRFPTGQRVGEDDVLNLAADHFSPPAWAPDVRTGHRDLPDLGDFLRDEVERGKRRAGQAPFRGLIGKPDCATEVAYHMDHRLRKAWDNVDTDQVLNHREKRAVKAMQWLASLADRRGLAIAMSDLAAANTCFLRAEKASVDAPEAAMTDSRAALALDPLDWKKRQLLGTLSERIGDVAGAETAFRAAMALGPTAAAPVLALARLLSGLGRKVEALRIAEDAAVASPSSRSLWELTSDLARANGQPYLARAFGQIALVQGLDLGRSHQRMALCHQICGDPVMAAFRKFTSDRLKQRAAALARV